MKPEDLLWKVLRATTNSPNDVWKLRHYERHKGIPTSLLGNSVIRFTVPILWLGQTNNGKNIYLVIQLCTDKLEFPHFAIDKDAFTSDLHSSREFVYVFNTRICLEDEFKILHKKRSQRIFNQQGSVKEEYRKGILANALGLISGTPRKRIIDKALNGHYKQLPENDWKGIIKIKQFNDDENEFRGNNKTKINNKK